MKKIFIAFGASVALICGLSSCDQTTSTTKADRLNDSLSVAYGDMVGKIILGDFTQFSQQNDAPDKAQLLKGLKMVYTANPDKGMLIGIQMATQMLSEIEHIEAQGVKIDRAKVLSAFMEAFRSDSIDHMDIVKASEDFQTIMAKAVEAAKETPEEAEITEEEVENPSAQNAQAADVFMEMTKTQNPNVITSASGLSYDIIAPGEGPHPTETSVCTVNYTGRLIDGTVFDASENHGGPATFPVNGVVPGFGEGLQLLGKGGKATLYIPGNLGYGEAGIPQAGIGPNEMLIFDIELIDFK